MSAGGRTIGFVIGIGITIGFVLVTGIGIGMLVGLEMMEG